MLNPNARIFARNNPNGIDLYLDISGATHYLVTQRSKGLLYLWLKGKGITLDELFRVKPGRNVKEQKIFHYALHLKKVVSEYIQFELSA